MTILPNETIPTSTNFMYYDGIDTPDQFYTFTYEPTAGTHRYVLTIAGVDNEFNVSFSEFAEGEDNANSLLREISSDVYKTIYKMSNARTAKKRRVVEYRLAKDPEIRNILFEVMLDYVRATMRSDWILVKDLNPVKKAAGLVLDFSDLPPIAPDALDGLLAYGLLYKGQYGYRILDADYRSDY